jgi:hypothetical protein
MSRRVLAAAIGLLAAVGTTGCAAMWAGAGAAGATGVYEARNKSELDRLESDRQSGRISEREYGTRKDAIEDRSLVY